MSLIEKNKKTPFRLTFADQGKLYLAEGYGEQKTTGYSVEVDRLCETQETVYIHTGLLGPEKGEEKKEIATYPYVVVELEETEKISGLNKEEKNGTDKKRIHYVREGKKIFDQFYVDEDYNVPEAKEDVRRIVDTGTELKIEEIRPVENYVRITGKLYFRILYLNVSSDPKPGVLEGKLPFEEMVYAENQEGEEFLCSECADRVYSVPDPFKEN